MSASAPPVLADSPALDFGHDALLARVNSSLQANLAQAQGQPNEAPPLVVGLFGEWGSGKSHLLEAVGRKVASWPKKPAEHNVVVRFNAWRYEREEHVLIPLLKVAQQALLKSLEAGVSADILRREKLSDRAVLLGRLAASVYAHGGKEALQWLWRVSMGAADGVSALVDGGEAAPKKTEAGAAAKEPFWAVWKKGQKALDEARQLRLPADALHSLYFDFQEHLKAVTGRNPKALKPQQERLTQGGLGAWPSVRHWLRLTWLVGGRSVSQPLTATEAETAAQKGPELRVNLIFLVDDLDRCLPDKAVEVLEAIKLFLEVPGCVFVLALDEEVVERGIAHRYRDYAFQGKTGMTPITGAEYLEKLVHLPVRLPRPTAEQARRHLLRLKGEVFAGREGQPNRLAELVCDLTPAVPRKYQRMVDLLALARELVQEQGLPWRGVKESWLVVACSLQLFAPALFRHLRVAGADLLVELAGWQGRELVDATWQCARLQRQLRREADAVAVRRLMSRQRLAELVAEGLHNRSGFDLLRVLAEVNTLQQDAATKLDAQQLTRLLTLTQDAERSLDDGSTPDESRPPFAALSDETVDGLLAAFRAGDAEALAQWLKAAAPGDAPWLLRDGVALGWLLRNEGADWRNDPEKAAPVWRCLAPHLSQWAVLRLAVEWGLQVLSQVQGIGWVQHFDGVPKTETLELTLKVSGPDALLRIRLPSQAPQRGSPWWRCPAMAGVLFTGEGVPQRFEVMQDGVGRYVEVAVGTVVQRFRWMPPGTFVMGSSSEEQRAAMTNADDPWWKRLRSRVFGGANWVSDEGPQHSVKFTQGFWLADTACTQALWLAVVGGENPSGFKGEDDLPVEQVSWDDVMKKFMPKLQGLLPEGVEATLPSEAQWEYACRAGTKTAFSFGEQINPNQVNYNGNHPYNGGPKGEYQKKTVPVKALAGNGWGLYQMHGNVWEWCFDERRTYAQGEAVDPLGAVGDGSRALRGGSWIGRARSARSAFRNQYERGRRLDRIGFRVALRFKPSQGR